jgi:hypothetical protein
LLKKCPGIHTGKIVGPADALPGRLRMDLKGQPLFDDEEFLFQLVDNTFADIAKGSDIIGVNGDIDGFHGMYLI